MIALLLVLAAVPCPEGVNVRACAEQDVCVARVLKTRTASTGVTVREAALVSRLDAERACALSAWAQNISGSTALQECLSVEPLCPVSVPMPPPLCEEFMTGLVAGVAACALCAGGVGIAIGFTQ